MSQPILSFEGIQIISEVASSLPISELFQDDYWIEGTISVIHRDGYKIGEFYTEDDFWLFRVVDEFVSDPKDDPRTTEIVATDDCPYSVIWLDLQDSAPPGVMGHQDLPSAMAHFLALEEDHMVEVATIIANKGGTSATPQYRVRAIIEDSLAND